MNNTAPGAAGADTVQGAQGADTAPGAAGADTVQGAQGADTTPGATGADTVQGAQGADTTLGAQGADTAQGAQGDDFTISAPEGFIADEAATKSLVDFVKAKGLTKEDAQGLADIGYGLVKQALETSAQAWRDQQAQWIEAAKKDAELGGVRFADNLKVIDKALAEVGTPELAAFLRETGLGANTELARFFYRVGKAISEDSFQFGGSRAAGSDLPTELVMFPTMRQ